MSWVRGSFIIPDDSDKNLKEAQKLINDIVRENTDLEEFPNMCSMNDLKKLTEEVFSSKNEAESYMEEHSDKWTRNYNAYLSFHDNGTQKVLVAYEEYVV